MGIVLPFAINNSISIMEGLHKITTVGNKPHVRPSGTNRKKDIMDIFRSEHIKKSKSTAHMSLS